MTRILAVRTTRFLAHLSRFASLARALPTLALLALAAAPAQAERGDQLFGITAADGKFSDNFGISVALAGNRALIGAPFDDDGGANSGSVYVFDVTTGEQIYRLTPGTPRAGALFGLVAADGNRGIVSAPFEDQIGAVYAFDLTTGNQTHRLAPSDGTSGDLFGSAIAISGGRVVIGAPQKPGTTLAGAVYIFNSGTGKEIAKLEFSDLAPGDQAGLAVAIDGDRIAVGAPFDDDNGQSSGSVYFFHTPTLDEITKVTPHDGGEAHAFGATIGVSNGIAIIGAPHQTDDGPFAGAAYLFDATSGDELFELRPNDANAFDFFGASVAIDGDIAVVGTIRDDTASLDAGAAYFFDVTTGLQIGKIAADDASENDLFGSAVDMDAGRAIVGSPFHDGSGGDEGKAYVFDTGAPVPVRLSAFHVTRAGPEAVLTWEVGDAFDHAGFLVYRELAGGERLRLTEGLLTGQKRYRFVDPSPPVSGASYWLSEIGRTGAREWHGPVRLGALVVEPGVRVQAAPNPFTSRTTLRVSLGISGPVRVSVLDMRGRLVREVANDVRTAGEHRLVWDGLTNRGDRAPHGLYFVRVETAVGVAAGKVLLSGK